MTRRGLPALSYDDAYRLRHYLPPATPAPQSFLPYPNIFSVSPARAEALQVEWRAAAHAWTIAPERTVDQLVAYTITFAEEFGLDEYVSDLRS